MFVMIIPYITKERRSTMMNAIPNGLSFSRIILSLFLIFVEPLSSAFYAIYILSGLSDILDGFIARRTGKTSRLGEKLDTFADMVMTGVLFVVLYPIVHLEAGIIIWIISIGFIRFVSIVVALKKHKTFAILHTYGNKFTGIVLFIFPIMLPVVSVTALMYIICFVASVSAIEELVIQLTSNQLQINKRSILTK
jgi:CDP-diacylglycerol---glycerol-3-phosphate 3-phosphatidyltransferase